MRTFISLKDTQRAVKANNAAYEKQFAALCRKTEREIHKALKRQAAEATELVWRLDIDIPIDYADRPLLATLWQRPSWEKLRTRLAQAGWGLGARQSGGLFSVSLEPLKK